MILKNPQAIETELQRRLQTKEPAIMLASTVMVACRTGNAQSLSVQASRGHCCTPKDDSGPYSTVEIVCYFQPSWRAARVLREINGPRKSNTPWRGLAIPYAPIGRVADLIALCGGLVADTQIRTPLDETP